MRGSIVMFADGPVATASLLSVSNTIAIAPLIRAANAPPRASRGLPFGSGVPAVEITSLDASRTTAREAAGQLLFFMGVTCRPCQIVATRLTSAKTSVLKRLFITVVGEVPSAGDSLLELLSLMPEARLSHDPDLAVAGHLVVVATRFAYAIKCSGRVEDKTAVQSATVLEAPTVRASAR